MPKKSKFEELRTAIIKYAGKNAESNSDALIEFFVARLPRDLDFGYTKLKAYTAKMKDRLSSEDLGIPIYREGCAYGNDFESCFNSIYTYSQCSKYDSVNTAFETLGWSENQVRYFGAFQKNKFAQILNATAPNKDDNFSEAQSAIKAFLILFRDDCKNYMQGFSSTPIDRDKNRAALDEYRTLESKVAEIPSLLDKAFETCEAFGYDCSEAENGTLLPIKEKKRYTAYDIPAAITKEDYDIAKRVINLIPQWAYYRELRAVGDSVVFQPLLLKDNVEPEDMVMDSLKVQLSVSTEYLTYQSKFLELQQVELHNFLSTFGFTARESATFIAPFLKSIELDVRGSFEARARKFCLRIASIVASLNKAKDDKSVTQKSKNKYGDAFLRPINLMLAPHINGLLSSGNIKDSFGSIVFAIGKKYSRTLSGFEKFLNDLEKRLKGNYSFEPLKAQLSLTAGTVEQCLSKNKQAQTNRDYGHVAIRYR
jgi:hypothetical protein